jgi:CheY-like chemotaxis protein
MRLLSVMRPAVLSVEDELLVADYVALLVQRFQCDVFGPVGGLIQAFEILAHKQPDAAILDVQLRRDETTYPVAAELRRRGIPFIFRQLTPVMR